MSKLDQILQFFNGNLPDVGLTRDALRNASPANLKRIYASLLVHNGICRENDILPTRGDPSDDWCGLKIAQQLTMFYNETRSSLNPPFSSLDLAVPEYNRTIILIFALIKFSYIRGEDAPLINDILTQRELIVKQQKDIHLQLVEKDELLLKKEEEIKTKRCSKITILSEVGSLKQQLNALKAQTASLDHESSSNAVRVAELNRAKESDEERIKNLNNDLEDCRGKLIQSPDRQKTELETQKADLERVRGRRTYLENSIEDLKNSIHSFESAGKHFTNFKKSKLIIDKKFGKLEVLRCDYTATQTLVRDEESEVEELRRKFTDLNSKYDTEMNDFERKRDLIETQEQHLQEMSRNIMDEIDQNNDNLQQIQTESRNLQQRNEQLKKETEGADCQNDLISFETGKRKMVDSLNTVLQYNEKLTTENMEFVNMIEKMEAKSLKGVQKFGELQKENGDVKNIRKKILGEKNYQFE